MLTTSQILDLLTGSTEHAKARANEKYYENKEHAHKKADEYADYASQKSDEAKAKSADYESTGKKYWNQKVEDAKHAADHAKVEL